MSRNGTKYPKHGMVNTPEYNSWVAMKTRCYNPNRQDWTRYGGRGIKVCERWIDSFLTFLADMGSRPPNTTLDRIDRDGDYTPENCRWADSKEQGLNTSKVTLITHNGITDSVCGWAKRIGVKQTVISRRLKRGWSVKDALEKPRLKTGKKYKPGKRAHWVEYRGERMTITQASKESGIHVNTIRWRLLSGKSMQQALGEI